MPTLSRRLLWPLAILLLVLGRPLAAADLYYLGQRIPDIQKPWDSHDYQVLIDALKKLEETQKNALPRRSGEFTGPLYLRMVSEENFRPQLNIYSPLEIRQNEAREVLFKLKELMRLYFDFRAAKQLYGAEALGLMSYSLREQSILFTLTVEFWMTLSQAEQRNPARLQGMQETKAAAAMLTGSALDYLGLTAQFERQDLVLYSAELAKEMPELFIHLPSPVRAQLLERIADFAKDHPYPEVRGNMRDLQPVLQAIQADVEKQLAPGRNAKAPAKALDLSPPPEGKPSGVKGL
ncbi:TPA: hypothetical protein ACL1ZM_002905 [Pseudomonas aeruginosa]